MAHIDFEDGALVLHSKYDPALVAWIKNLPTPDRKWDASRKVWLIDPRHGDTVVHAVELCLNQKVQLPIMPSATAATVTRTFEVRYVGACKERGNGTATAFGWVDGEWRVVFSERVLRGWFGEVLPGDDDDAQASRAAPRLDTLYTILGVAQSASEPEIKSAYRRVSKQWHPDICQEPNAHEMFIRIRDAYAILNDSFAREKYDAGLRLQATLTQADNYRHYKQATFDASDMRYRAPLRCGLITCTGIERMGRFIVESITQWDDITRTRDGQTKTLVTSWQAGNDTFTEAWV